MVQQTTDLQTEHINYPGATGEVRAYFVRPNGDEKRPGVVVIHENQGLAPHIEDVNRRVASEGFLSLAPDSLTPLGGTPQNLDKAIALTKSLNKKISLSGGISCPLITCPYSLEEGRPVHREN